MEYDKILKGPIDDNRMNHEKTWSSYKIKNEIDSNKLVTKTFTINSWAESMDSNLFMARINHNLNSKNLIINAYNTNTKNNELISYKIIDENNIEILAEDADSLEVNISSGSMSTINVKYDIINDKNIEIGSTWSSQKINELTGNMAVFIDDMVDKVLAKI